jgi:hypothetical protein
MYCATLAYLLFSYTRRRQRHLSINTRDIGSLFSGRQRHCLRSLLLNLLVGMARLGMPAIVAVVAGAFVVYVAKLMANRQHVKILQKAGAVSRVLNTIIKLPLMITSPCRNTTLSSAISFF